MRLVVLAVLAIVPAGQARHAVAGACGGGGGHGSKGSGGHGGGGARHDACADTSDVVGYRTCTGFGAWGSDLKLPPVSFEAGAIVRRFGSLLDGQTGHFAHGGESFAYRVIEPPQGRGRLFDTAVLSTVRAGVSLPYGLYTALEVDFGGLAQPGHAETEMMSTGVFGSPDVSQRRGFVLDSLATVGAHGALHAGGLGVELSGGMRAVSYGFRSDYHDCQQSMSIWAYGAIAEARARGELWLSPWLTAGVTVGTSVLEKNTWMGGLYVGVHTRAFGGER